MNRRLLGGFLTFAVLVVLALELPFGFTLVNDARTSHVNEVVSDASSLSYLVGRAYASGDVATARAVLEHFATSAHAIVVVTEGGRPVISAGVGAAEELADPATTPILTHAAEGRASGEEGSTDPDDDLLYAAAPLVLHVGASEEGRPTQYVRGVIFVATSAVSLHDAIRRDVERLVGFGAVLLFLAAMLGTLLARSLTRPLAAIERVVAAHGRGELSQRAPENDGPHELRAHARTVNEMAARIDELVVAQRSFAADAAHQLRSPLTALRLRLENLERRRSSDTGAELEACIAEADRLSRVIDGILTLARADGVRQGCLPVEVVGALRERAEAWRPLTSERGIELLVADAAGPLLAEAGSGFLEQILDNLLANALDATQPGGTITLSADPRGGSVEVRVVDTGIGMTEVERAHAFDRFWRATPRGDGTGLGLAIVAQLVRASGGTCRLDPSDTGGTDAVVALRATDGKVSSTGEPAVASGSKAFGVESSRFG